MKRLYGATILLVAILATLVSCKPSPPTLVSPTDGSINTVLNPSLKWNPSEGAKSYGLEISTDSGIVISLSGINTPGYGVPIGRLLNSAVYSWRVNARSFWGTSEWSDKWTFTIQCEADDDNDGIPNEVEVNVLHTNPNKKTLFVKPSKMTSNGKEYWRDFVEVLFPQNGPNGRVIGYAEISPFTDTDIEVIVIGDDHEGHPYPPMRNYNYDPAQDPNRPPCDILEIVLEARAGAYCDVDIGTQIKDPKGHTYFAYFAYFATAAKGTWSWDTKGYTKSGQNTGQFKSYGNPWVYQYPLDNYFEEGAYKRIAENEAVVPPLQTVDPMIVCTGQDCGKSTNNRSPMSLGPVIQGPSGPDYGPPDGKVEFNEISFHNDGRIEKIGQPNQPNPKGKEYDKNTVLKRTIVHEMGHAVSNNYGHCSNPNCIMYEATVDWEMHPFGTGSCNHRDLIRAGIYNKVP